MWGDNVDSMREEWYDRSAVHNFSVCGGVSVQALLQNIKMLEQTGISQTESSRLTYDVDVPLKLHGNRVHGHIITSSFLPGPPSPRPFAGPVLHCPRPLGVQLIRAWQTPNGLIYHQRLWDRRRITKWYKPVETLARMKGMKLERAIKRKGWKEGVSVACVFLWHWHSSSKCNCVSIGGKSIFQNYCDLQTKF